MIQGLVNQQRKCNEEATNLFQILACEAHRTQNLVDILVLLPPPCAPATPSDLLYRAAFPILPLPILRKAIAVLTKSARAQIIAVSDGEGVRFLTGNPGR